MEPTTIISFFVAPVIFLALALISRRNLDNRSFRVFLSTYFLGILTVIPMIIALTVAAHYGWIHVKSIRRILFYTFFLIAFFAEFSKFLLLRYYYIPKNYITRPIDGVVFSVTMSLGFATAANFYFSLIWYQYANLNLSPINYSMPFANLLVGVIMGFFIGIGAFRRNYIDHLTGLGAAIFFQGFYNFCLITNDYLLLSLVGFGTLVIAVLLIAKAVNTDQESIL